VRESVRRCIDGLLSDALACAAELHANLAHEVVGTLLQRGRPPFSLAALSESISAKALLLSPVLEAPALDIDMSPWPEIR